MTQTILHIDSSARTEGSVTRQLTSKIVAKIATPTDTVVTRDLLNGVSLISEDWVIAARNPDATEEQKEAIKSSNTLIQELKDADTIVIGAPIYNFGIPGALKAWVDQICRAGQTFQYGANGPEGLLTNKKAIVAIASGGVPVGSDMDLATPYLKFVLGFVGITDVVFVSADGLVTDEAAALARSEDQIAAL